MTRLNNKLVNSDSDQSYDDAPPRRKDTRDRRGDNRDRDRDRDRDRERYRDRSREGKKDRAVKEKSNDSSKSKTINLSFQSDGDDSDSDGVQLSGVQKGAKANLKKIGDATKSRFQSEKNARKRKKIDLSCEGIFDPAGSSTSASSSFTKSLMPSDEKQCKLDVHLGKTQILGKRKTQEDRHCESLDDPSLVSFAVLDGHGGHRAASWLSKKLIPRLHEILEKERWRKVVAERSTRQNICDVWRSTFKCLDVDLLDDLHLQGKEDGSTCVVASIMQSDKAPAPILVTGHCGDSRALLIRQVGKAPVRLTHDHKADDPIEKKRIEDAGGKVISNAGVARIKEGNRGLAIARAFGDTKFKEGAHLKKGPVVIVTPDVNLYQINPDIDLGVIVASDGLWEKVTDATVAATANGMIEAAKLRGEDASESLAEKVSKALCDKAKKAGGTDNTTIGVMLFERK